MEEITMEPKTTTYKDHIFRSRLKAKWARFLEALGITWSYEEKGYDLSGEEYFPDFWLPAFGCWLKIRGTQPTTDYLQRIARFVEEKQQICCLLWGDLYPYVLKEKPRLLTDDPLAPPVFSGKGAKGRLCVPARTGARWSEGHWMFQECPQCRTISLGEEQRSLVLSPQHAGALCPCGGCPRNNTRRLEAAYILARYSPLSK